MAEGYLQLPADGVGKKLDAFQLDNLQYREAVVLGSPTLAANTIEPTDVDSGVGTDFALPVSVRKAKSGGSVEYGTSTDPLRTDPTGTTVQPVSGTVTANIGTSGSLATAAKQPALGTAGTASADVITIQGIASMTKLLVTPDSVALPANQSVNCAQLAGTTTDTNSGSKSAGTLRVVLATDQPALTNKLLVTPDANSAVNVAQFGGTNVVTGGTSGLVGVGGPAASGASASGNPLRNGCLGRTTLPTSVSSAQMVDVLSDRYGRIYTVAPVATVTSSAGTAITTNTNTSIVAAPSAGNHLRVHRLWAQNSSATGTWCYWGNGSGVKTIPFYLAQNQPFSMDLKGGWELSTATALFMNTATTGANIEWMVITETLTD